MFDTLFIQIAAVIVTAGLVALMARILRQPLIIAYIVTGLIVGPSVLGFANSQEIFQALSEIGIAFLLFLVGLELNWRNVKDVGPISLLAGIGQVLVTSTVGYFVISALGFDTVTSLFLGVIFSFSSTIVIIKLLSDKEDLERLHGRISIGILILQDLVAMGLLLVVASMQADPTGDIGAVIVTSIFKLIVVVAGVWLISKLALEPLFKFAAHSQELLFLVAVAWCFSLASALHLLGFGIEIGALLAGVSLAGLDFHREIASKIRPLRDFFLIIFFIVLGTTLSLDRLDNILIPSLILSAFILIGNPLIVILILRAFGYHPRTGFLVGVTMAQISEFSFIILAGGIGAGLVSPDLLALTTVVALITIAGSTYLIQYNEQIYELIEFAFKPFEMGTSRARTRLKKTSELILFGYHRIGEAVMPQIKKITDDYLVVDIDPAAIHELEEAGIPHVYGDAGDFETLVYLRAERADIVISTIPDASISKDIVSYLKKKRSHATIIVTVKTGDEAAVLYAAGADFVIVPNVLGGEYFGHLLEKMKTRKTAWNSAAKRQKKAYGIS